MKQSVLLTVLAVGSVFLTGCYTQLTTIDRTPPPQPKEEVEWVVDTATGDTVKVVRQVDTIQTEDHQTCIWERDLMGYPHLRCYDSFYPRDWFYYNNSPWWYRNDPYWYDYDRCPRYYYYDPSCGCCRYTADFYHSSGRRYYDRDGIQVGKSEPAGPSGSSMSPRVRGIPNPRSEGMSSGSRTPSSSTRTQASTSSGNRSSGEIIIPAPSGEQSSRDRGRGRGVSDRGSAAAVPSAPPPATSSNSGSAKTATTSNTSQSQSTVAPSNSNTQQSSPPSGNNHRGNDNQRRTRPRSR